MTKPDIKSVVPGLILTLYLPRHLCMHQGVFQLFCIISMIAYLMQWYFIKFQLSRGAKRSFGSILFNYLAKRQFGHFLYLLFIIFFPFISLSFLLINGCHFPLNSPNSPVTVLRRNVIQTRPFVALIIGIHLCLNFFFRRVVLAQTSWMKIQT